MLTWVLYDIVNDRTRDKAARACLQIGLYRVQKSVFLGEVPPLQLPSLRERHIRCNPATAQYIVDPDFPPVRCEGMFAKENLDPSFVKEEELRVTRAWRRLQELPTLGLPITEYPLPEVLEAWGQEGRKP